MNFFYEKYILFAQGAGPHLVVYNKHIFMFAFKFFYFILGISEPIGYNPNPNDI